MKHMTITHAGKQMPRTANRPGSQHGLRVLGEEWADLAGLPAANKKARKGVAGQGCIAAAREVMGAARVMAPPAFRDLVGPVHRVRPRRGTGSAARTTLYPGVVPRTERPWPSQWPGSTQRAACGQDFYCSARPTHGTASGHAQCMWQGLSGHPPSQRLFGVL